MFVAPENPATARLHRVVMK